MDRAQEMSQRGRQRQRQRGDSRERETETERQREGDRETERGKKKGRGEGQVLDQRQSSVTSNSLHFKSVSLDDCTASFLLRA
jgi:hypothetical protein